MVSVLMKPVSFGEFWWEVDGDSIKPDVMGVLFEVRAGLVG